MSFSQGTAYDFTCSISRDIKASELLLYMYYSILKAKCVLRPYATSGAIYLVSELLNKQEDDILLLTFAETSSCASQWTINLSF